MTISEQARQTREALAEWAQQFGGTAAVASDQVHMIDLLRTKPGGVFVGVLFETEDPRGEHDELGRVDRGFKVVVSRGRGFKLETGESLTEGSAGGPPMFGLVEGAREVVRLLRFTDETTEVVPNYRGSGPFEVQGFILDAYEVRFSIGTQLPYYEE